MNCGACCWHYPQDRHTKGWLNIKINLSIITAQVLIKLDYQRR